MKTRIRKKLHPTGQLSIFAILIFQVLFVLFAMSLNIALVVHDKINLQNSVDLATYYGAMKQAEMMNTVAHINYQIRQSLKLLAWRYRVLGSMAQSYSNPGSSADTEHILYPYGDVETRITNSSRPGPPFFCLGHPWWSGFEEGSSTATRVTDMICKYMGSTTSAITVPRVTGTLGSFVGTLTGVRDMGIAINTKLARKCDFYAYNSWLLGMMSFIHFRRDQAARKYMIYQLAKIMAGDGPTGHPHGTDLNGNSIEVGVRKTFEKNLSFINKKAFERDIDQLKQFNSLQKAIPTEWLMDQEFLTSGFYSHFYGTGGECRREVEYVNNPPAAVKDSIQAKNLLNEIGDHGSWPCLDDPNKCNSSAGLKKKESFVIFYSVKAELDYKNQIFLPFSQNIKLKAKAFAKPFGGRIGPKKSADPLLPSFVSSPPGIMEPIVFDKQFGPNYSRYPGDPHGLRSKYTHYYWIRHIRENARTQASIKYYYPLNYPHSNDPLARHDTVSPGTGILPRKWELAAVAPDLFDVTYFTILPYYTYTHFPAVQTLLGNASYIRGDLGIYKADTGKFQGKSILHQVGFGSSPSRNVWESIPSLPQRLRTPFFYKIGHRKQPKEKLNLLLTGWNPPRKKYQSGDNDYEAVSGKTNFANCFVWVHSDPANINPHSPTTKGKIANGCIYGGRTGYSVKMISEDFLRGFTDRNNPVPEGDPEWYQP